MVNNIEGRSANAHRVLRTITAAWMHNLFIKTDHCIICKDINSSMNSGIISSFYLVCRVCHWGARHSPCPISSWLCLIGTWWTVTICQVTLHQDTHEQGRQCEQHGTINSRLQHRRLQVNGRLACWPTERAKLWSSYCTWRRWWGPMFKQKT